MNPELTLIAIPFACGFVFGVIAAILSARPHINELLAKREKDTWKQAMKFYAAKNIEHLNKQL